MPVPLSKEKQEDFLKYLRVRIEYSTEIIDKQRVRWEDAIKNLRARSFTDRGPDSRVDDVPQIDARKTPYPIVTVPYVSSTLNTIATYIHAVFFGRDPVFPVLPSKAIERTTAQQMEKVLQHFVEHDKLGMQGWRMMHDGLTYGLGILRVRWHVEMNFRTRLEAINTGAPTETQTGQVGNTDPRITPRRTLVTTYEGPSTENVSPYSFMPDPRVPPSEAYKDAEYVFFASYETKSWLKKMIDADGWVLNAGDKSGKNAVDGLQLAMKDNFKPFEDLDGIKERALTEDLVLVEQGTIFIDIDALGIQSPVGDTPLPTELRGSGLGGEDGLENEPGAGTDASTELPVSNAGRELWRVTIINRKYIVDLRPWNHDHGYHPCVVFEPYRTGYGFASPSLVDYIAPMQELMSSLLNYRSENTFKHMNPRFVFDPKQIAEDDVINPPNANSPIRIQNPANGQAAKDAIHQLQIQDVTQGAIGDFGLLKAEADAATGVDENRRGSVNPGRQTATEVRVAADAGASRLAAQAQLFSYHVMQPLAQMWSIDAQQLLSPEYEQRLLGQDPNASFRSAQIAGDFNFKISDGNLAPDPLARLQVWVNVLQQIQSSPLFVDAYNIGELFAHVVQQAGVDSLDSFRLDPNNPEHAQIAQRQLQLLLNLEGPATPASASGAQSAGGGSGAATTPQREPGT